MPPATEESNNPLMRPLEQWDWAIDAHRRYLSGNFPRSPALTLFSIAFLTMAEMIRLRYTEHLREDLQAGVEGIRYGIFEFMSAIPILGVIAIRVIEFFTVSQSVILTVCLVVISTVPVEVLAMALRYFHGVRHWVNRTEQEEGNDVEAVPLPEQTALREGYFASTETRLRSILDTFIVIMWSMITKIVHLPLLKSVCTVTALVVTGLVMFLGRFVCSTYHRLRGRGRLECTEEDTSHEGTSV
ncbi:hypothetical protein V8B97DRAFT_1944404 [Scleroderma yunnanense]